MKTSSGTELDAMKKLNNVRSAGLSVKSYDLHSVVDKKSLRHNGVRAKKVDAIKLTYLLFCATDMGKCHQL